MAKMAPAFESGSIELKPEWHARIAQLPQALEDKPSVARVAYVRHGEDRRLAAHRQAALVKEIKVAAETAEERIHLLLDAGDVRPGTAGFLDQAGVLRRVLRRSAVRVDRLLDLGHVVTRRVRLLDHAALRDGSGARLLGALGVVRATG